MTVTVLQLYYWSTLIVLLKVEVENDVSYAQHEEYPAWLFDVLSQLLVNLSSITYDKDKFSASLSVESITSLLR